MMIREKWKEASSLSLVEAAFLMLGIDPDDHEDDAYFKPEYLEHFNNHQVGDRVSGKVRTLFGAAKDKLIETAPSSLPADEIANAPSIRILTSSYVKWLGHKAEYSELVAAFSYAEQSSTSAERQNKSAAAAEWITRAVTLADKYIEAWREAGYEPTVVDAALYVEGALSTERICGPRGRFLDKETIKREALSGITGHPKGFKSDKPKVPEGQRGKMPQNKWGIPI